MLRYLYADQLGDYPYLAQSMFRDRAMQFRTRMGWDVKVDENGEERDQYERAAKRRELRLILRGRLALENATHIKDDLLAAMTARDG